MIRQAIAALLLALCAWNAAEEIWDRHYGGGCRTDTECGCTDDCLAAAGEIET